MTYKECLEYIKSDYYRWYETENSLIKMWLHSFRNTGFRYMFWFRFCSIDNTLMKIIFKYKHRVLSQKTGIELTVGTNIGYGFRIDHGCNIIINHTAKIGNNCTICQYTTIGSLKNKAAEIGDNVYIGPSVCIVENVKIGNNVTIGAGSVVVKDVPDDCTVAGVPTKVISKKTPGRFIFKKWTKIK